MRKRMKKLASAVLAAAMLLATPLAAQAAWANPFTDVKPGDWYYEAVEYVNEEGLFSGVSPDTFSPSSPMTRGMFVTVLGKFAAIDPEAYSNSTFTDVSPTAYYAPYVEWAAEQGLVNGVGGGRFAPNSSITREQMATIFYKYAKVTGADTSVTPERLLDFPDGIPLPPAGDGDFEMMEEIIQAVHDGNMGTSKYAQQAMAWAVTHGVLSGSDGKLLPQGTATRAQTAQIIYNAHELLSTQVDTPPANSVWVVDQQGSYESWRQCVDAIPVPGTEVGHWEDEYESHTVYMCNQDRMVFETLEELHAHQEANFNWDTMTGTCWSYSLVASDPKPTGEKIWVVDSCEYEYVWITEHEWTGEIGHWEAK